MQVMDIFTSFLAIEQLDLDVAQLEKFCIDQIPNDRVNKTFDLTEPELQPLLQTATQKVNDLHAHLGLNPDFEQYIDQCWANRNYPNSTTQAHCHPESFFSCVFYVTGNNDAYGHIHFINPVTQMVPVVRPYMVKEWNRYWNEGYRIPPYSNALLIFPSWLWHYVDATTSATGRISIAMDTKIKVRD
jgi:uncharacterized protein (TIGR02466 family)